MTVYSQAVRIRNGRFPRGGKVEDYVCWYSLEACSLESNYRIKGRLVGT